MSKTQDCQFIQIKVDGKPIEGASVEKNYKGWMEGYAPTGLSSVAGPDGAYFDPVNLFIFVTPKTGMLYEQYLKRGHKKIEITIVHRGSDQYSADYEIQKTVYQGCIINRIFLGMYGENGMYSENIGETKLCMDVSFRFTESVEVTFNVPNSNGDALEQVGPIKYLIPEKSLA